MSNVQMSTWKHEVPTESCCQSPPHFFSSWLIWKWMKSLLFSHKSIINIPSSQHENMFFEMLASLFKSKHWNISLQKKYISTLKQKFSWASLRKFCTPGIGHMFWAPSDCMGSIWEQPSSMYPQKSLWVEVWTWASPLITTTLCWLYASGQCHAETWTFITVSGL